MIPVATTQEIKDLDNKTKSGDIKKGFELMKQAAKIIFDLTISEILKLEKSSKKSTILILCGKGNNGGDGLLTASYLIEQGYPVKCMLFADPAELKDEAKLAYEHLLNVKKAPCTFIFEEADLVQLKDFLNNLTGSDYHCLVIDALYGIGYKVLEENPLLEQTAKLLNESPKEKTIIAIDGPSGIDSDNGFFKTTPIKANYSLAMGFPKLGNFFYPGRALSGLIFVGSLNYSHQDVKDCLKSKIYFVDSVKHFFPGRALNGSKYDHGYVANIAGAQDMTGAAILSSRAVLKAGAGMVKTFCEDPSTLVLACNEALTCDLKNTQAQDILADQKTDCIAIGPGLGNSYDELVYEIVSNSSKPIIIDADAINAFARNREKLKKHKTQIIITPHVGEYQRLFPEDADKFTSPISVINALKQRAQEFQMSILLKGSPTIIVDPSQEVFILPHGNSGLATAGSGDVLTGIIAAFMAQSIKRQNKYLINSSIITQSAILAVFLHGKTAELIAPEITEYSMKASDIINNLHRAIKFTIN